MAGGGRSGGRPWGDLVAAGGASSSVEPQSILKRHTAELVAWSPCPVKRGIGRCGGFGAKAGNRQ
jgi:hypothetical protein